MVHGEVRGEEGLTQVRMERQEQAERCYAGQFNKNVAIDWLKRGLGKGAEEEVHEDAEVKMWKQPLLLGTYFSASIKSKRGSLFSLYRFF